MTKKISAHELAVWLRAKQRAFEVATQYATKENVKHLEAIAKDYAKAEMFIMDFLNEKELVFVKEGDYE